MRKKLSKKEKRTVKREKKKREKNLLRDDVDRPYGAENVMAENKADAIKKGNVKNRHRNDFQRKGTSGYRTKVVKSVRAGKKRIL